MSHADQYPHRVANRRGSRVCSNIQRVRNGAGYGDDAGFTLIEAIVSFTIFAIVSAAAVLALVTGAKANNQTSDRVTAAQIAQQVTDQARAMPRRQLTATPNQTTTQSVGGKTFSITRTVTYPASQCLAASAMPVAGDESVRKIAVRVDVTSPGTDSRSVRMDSVLAC